MNLKTSPNWKPWALVVDDIADWRFLFSEMFERLDWRVDEADNVPDALKLIERGSHQYHVAIVDKGGSGAWSGEPDIIGHRDGLRVLKELKSENPGCIRILATGEPWNPNAFTDPKLELQVFYDKRCGDLKSLSKLINQWKPREDGLPHLFLYEPSSRGERRRY